MPPRSNPFFLHRPDGSGVSDPGYRRKAEIGKAESRKRKTGDGGPGSADVLVGRCEGIDSNLAVGLCSKNIRRDVRRGDRGQRPRLQKNPAKKKPSFQLSAFIPSLPEVAGMVFLFRRLRLFFPPAIGSDPP